MLLKIIAFFLFINVSLVSLAQIGSIKGHIAGTEQTDLPGISLTLDPGNAASQTDKNGNFSFDNVAPGKYLLVATGVGYTAKSQQLVVASGKTIYLDFELNTATATLTDVTVLGRGRTGSTLTRMNIPLIDLPQNIQAVPRSLIADQQIFNLNDAFKNVAGITSTDYYGGFNSRGYTTGVSDITINGIRGNPYPEGQSPLLGNVESIEVIHGPNAILFGPGGMGGNVNIVTKQPKKATTVYASASAGSFDLYRVQADVSGSINKKKSLYYVASVAGQDGGMFTEHFKRRNLQLYGAVKWEIAPKTSWMVNATYQNDEATNNYQPVVPIYNTQNKDSIFLVSRQFNDGADSGYHGSNYQVQSILEHQFSADWKLGLLLSHNESNAKRRQFSSYDYVSPVDNTVPRSFLVQQIVSPQNTANLYGVGKFNTWSIKHHFSAGADINTTKNDYPNGFAGYLANNISVINPDYNEQFDTSGQTPYYRTRSEKFTYTVAGGYIMDQITIIQKLKLLAGLRYNYYHRRYGTVKPDGSVGIEEKPENTTNLSPRVGLVYQPVSNISVYTNYNEGFSPQYGNYADNGGPFDPETSKEFEVGAKGEFLSKALQPFITIYQSTRKNVLQAAPRPNFPRWQEAIGEVRSRGIETGISGNVLPNLFINFNYNYNKTKITESKKPEQIGQLFANVPENTANGWVRYTIGKSGLKGLFVGAGFQYVDVRYFTNKTVGGTAPEMPTYTVFDALLGYRYKQYSLQVNANNLLDKKYATSGYYYFYAPGTPRNFLVTLACSFR